MKPRLSPALHQHLVLTPQLRQAIRLLQLSTAELEAEVADAVASNPLLDWTEDADQGDVPPGERSAEMADVAPQDAHPEERWDRDAEPWQERIGPGGDFDEDMGDPGDRASSGETLRDHLLWQLYLGHFGQRDAVIGLAIVDAIDDDGYLRDSLDAIAEVLSPGVQAAHPEIQQVLHRIQQFDPVAPGPGPPQPGIATARRLAGNAPLRAGRHAHRLEAQALALGRDVRVERQHRAGRGRDDARGRRRVACSHPGKF